MEFLSFNAKTRILSLCKRDIPKPVNDEVLIKVAYSGICGTDIHILDGQFPCREDAPFTLGHEFVGTILDIGSGVKTFKIGDRVVVDPNSGCNLCYHCHNGNYHYCLCGGIHNTLGIFRNGGWATHALVPESQTHLIPDTVEMSQAALSEPLSCLAHGWDVINPVVIGTRILLLGAGIIGLLWASVFHLYGVRKTVIISEIQERRRKMIEKLDLGYSVTKPADLKGEYDLAVDCTGSVSAMESALELLGPGGRLCVFGVANPETRISVSPFEIYKKELKIMGVNINPYTLVKGLSLVEAMAERYLSFEKLGIKIFKLSEYREALAALKKGEISKAVFKL